jgi:chorismate mutase / prephenate dehydratase
MAQRLVCRSVADDKREDVDAVRREMGELDRQMLALVDRRARAARRIAELRKGQPPGLPVNDPAAIRDLVAHSSGDLAEEPLREIFRTIFAACLAIELPAAVAFVGLDGDAASCTAQGRFGSTSPLKGFDTTEAALEEVARRRAEFAVVPFETSADGPVRSTIAGLVASDLRVVEVIDASFDLQVMSRTGHLADVETIYATAIDRASCRQALGEMARFAALDVETPVLACQLAAEDPRGAAIAIERVGAKIGLHVVRRGVANEGGARIRFAVVGSRPSRRTTNDVTSFVFSVQGPSGSLLDVLKVFAERGVHLTKIQSHPLKGEAYNYLFYAETLGHFTDRPLIIVFEELRRVTRFFKLLGSYPAG